MTQADERITTPIPVEIKNWAPPIKPSNPIKKTTLRTYIIDPTGVVGQKNIQICDYEPQRMRLAIQPVDVAITITNDSPVTSPEAAPGVANSVQGSYLPPLPGNTPYEFFGPDAFWINSLTGTTGRVTVVKEYC